MPGLERHEQPLGFDIDTVIQVYEQVQNHPYRVSQDNFKPLERQSDQLKEVLSEKHILLGQPHQTLCDIKMLVYDYDDLGIRSELLTAGSFFQPWKPLEHWHGSRIPITLGHQSTGFDWGVRSFTGHFLKWDDYFYHCQVIQAKSDENNA